MSKPLPKSPSKSVAKKKTPVSKKVSVKPNTKATKKPTASRLTKSIKKATPSRSTTKKSTTTLQKKTIGKKTPAKVAVKTVKTTKVTKIAKPKVKVATKVTTKPAVKKAVHLKKVAPIATKKVTTKKAVSSKITGKVATSKKSHANSDVKKSVKHGKATPHTKPKASVSKPVGKQSQAFLDKQREHLLALKDTLLDSMRGVTRDSLRSGGDGNDASAFGMHQADAGSDAYDRDFALSLLSQDQNALYEIDAALKRIDQRTYGICEMSGKPIPNMRLEALPFTRYTVECQAELEKRHTFRQARQPIGSLFSSPDDESGDLDDDDFSADSKD